MNEDQHRAAGAVSRAFPDQDAVARALKPVFFWRSLVAGSLAGGLALPAVLTVPGVTQTEGAALGGGLALLGIALGGILDLRALGRRIERAGLRPRTRAAGKDGNEAARL